MSLVPKPFRRISLEQNKYVGDVQGSSSATKLEVSMPIRVPARTKHGPSSAECETVAVTAAKEDADDNKDAISEIPEKDVIGNNNHLECQQVSDIQFNCTKCDRKFGSCRALISHAKIHKGRKKLSSTCTYCCEVFCNKAALLKHIKTIHGCDARSITAKSQACPHCGRICRDQHRLDSHIRFQHENRRVSAQKPQSHQRGKILMKQKRLNAHIQGQYDRIHVAAKHSCPKCEQICRTRDSLRAHVKKHHRILKTCKNRKGLESHIRNEHGSTFTASTQTTCLQCGENFQSQTLLSKHVKSKHGGWQCKMCTKTFHGASHLERHMAVHTKEKAFQCSKCKLNFARLDNMRTHSKSHTDQDFCCKQCELSFTNKFRLIQHVNTVHKVESQLRGLPQTTVPSSSSIKASPPKLLTNSKFKPKRIRSEGYVSCPYCSMVFQYPSRLQRHMVVHTKEKIYQCGKCMTSFGALYRLKNHSRRHGDRDYHCGKCPLMFIMKRDLDKHIIIFHGSQSQFVVPSPSTDFSHTTPVVVQNKERPKHRCTQCSKVFQKLYNFQRHSISHSEERNFKCTGCDKAYKYPHDLRGHQRKSISCQMLKSEAQLASLKPEPDSKFTFDDGSSLTAASLQTQASAPPVELPQEIFNCKYCGKHFFRQQSLMEHLSSHGGVSEKFQCTKCIQRVSFSELASHMRIHENQTPHVPTATFSTPKNEDYHSPGKVTSVKNLPNNSKLKTVTPATDST